MNKQIRNNRYILKGTRKWHDFICSNFAIPIVLVMFTIACLASLVFLSIKGGY
jgi:hypothetical protein